jgi:hypothetical protein
VGRISLGLALWGLLTGCGTTPEPEPPAGPESCDGEALFGRPTAMTGLGDDQCGPVCTCSGEPWAAPAYTEADAEALRAWILDEPFAELSANPYESGDEPPTTGPDAVCAIVKGAEGHYSLQAYESTAQAESDGATPTHYGGCGLCSTLADLAVYMSHPDLTDPVRQCGLDHLAGPPEDHVACLEALGFTLPCAQIWYWNTINTRKHCAPPCFATLEDPYHLPDGTLNECLQCDEDVSGPVFKAVAGRTRRNTGLASSMCRPCSEVKPLVHDYD